MQCYLYLSCAWIGLYLPLGTFGGSRYRTTRWFCTNLRLFSLRHNYFKFFYCLIIFWEQWNLKLWFDSNQHNFQTTFLYRWCSFQISAFLKECTFSENTSLCSVTRYCCLQTHHSAAQFVFQYLYFSGADLNTSF